MILTGTVRVWTDDGPEKGVAQECHGEPTDVAAAILSAFDDDSPVTGLLISLTPVDGEVEMPIRKSDPRNG